MADRDEDPRHRVADLDRQEEEDPRLEANDEENNLDNEEEDPDGQAAAVGDETMRLTEEERQWAFSIMAAIEDDPELDAGAMARSRCTTDTIVSFQ